MGVTTATTSLLVRLDPVIAKLETARQALAEAVSIQQVKQIADVAAAAEVYARRQQLGEEAIGYAHSVKIEALARLGELLKATAGAGERAGKGRPSENLPDGKVFLPTLAELGISEKTSHIAQQLADLSPDVRVQIAERELTLTEARRQANHARRPFVQLPKGQYRVIYADPPWQYRDTRAGLGDGQRVDRAETAAEQDYPTMSVAELGDLDVRSLAGPDSVLFCWATFPLLPDALQVVKSWGFEYKTAFVWQKPRGSFGHYHKADAELLLVATHGSCTPDAETRPSQIFQAESTWHSHKPDSARGMIDALYPHGPRIELFARRSADKRWAVWGNES